GHRGEMHKYAIQIAVADERDGGLSGSTPSEAQSWGKVEASLYQMVFAEATLAFPLLASYVWHRAPARAKRRYAELFRREPPAYALGAPRGVALPPPVFLVHSRQMPDELRLFLKERFGVQGPLSPGRFEAELAKRLGSPARRAPPLKAWRAYLAQGGREAV